MSNNLVDWIIGGQFIGFWILIGMRGIEPLRAWVWQHRWFGMFIVALMLGAATDLLILFFIGLSHGHISHHNFIILLIPSYGAWLMGTILHPISPKEDK